MGSFFCVSLWVVLSTLFRWPLTVQGGWFKCGCNGGWREGGFVWKGFESDLLFLGYGSGLVSAVYQAVRLA